MHFEVQYTTGGMHTRVEQLKWYWCAGDNLTHLQLDRAPQFLHVHGDNNLDLSADFPQGSDGGRVVTLYLRHRVYHPLFHARMRV